jgi:hypothetical protein
MAQIQNTDNTKCCQGYGTIEVSFIAGENAKWYKCFDRQFGGSYKIKHALNIQKSYSSIYYQRS